MKDLMKMIPAIVLLISIGFCIYASFVLMDVQNQCNQHLIDQYENFKESCACEDEVGTGFETLPNATIRLPPYPTFD